MARRPPPPPVASRPVAPRPARRKGRGRSLRRVVGATAAAAVGAVAVVGLELQLARLGPAAPPLPTGVDGCVGCTAVPDDVPLRVAWLGDSTAAGVGASSAAATLPRQVAAATGRPVEVSVLARSGARIADVVDEQLPQLAALRPHLVVVSVGANDAAHLTGVGAFARRWEQVVPPPGARLVALGIPDMGSPPRLAQPLRALVGWRGRRLDARGARRLAAAGRATWVDVAGRTGPAFRRHPDRYFSADGYHPSDAGYRLWADAVVDAIGPCHPPPPGSPPSALPEPCSGR